VSASDIFNALSLGSVLLLIALGLAITFGLMRVINMAHGEFIMTGAYVTYVTQNLFKQFVPEKYFGAYFLVAIPFAFLVTAAMGWLLEVLVIRKLYGRTLDTLLATWGVSLILQQLARSIFGAANVNVLAPSWLDGQWQFGTDVSLPYNRLFIIGLAAVCLASMWVYLYASNPGRNIQAVMQNRDMAACIGIPTRKVDSRAFALGSGFAGVAGCAVALLGSIGSATGTYYIVQAFMVVVLGGVGQLSGAVAGAAGIGLLNTLWEVRYSSSVAIALTIACIIAFLQWKPGGIAPTKTRSLD
jgi:urea transport system permease protein